MNLVLALLFSSFSHAALPADFCQLSVPRQECWILQPGQPAYFRELVGRSQDLVKEFSRTCPTDLAALGGASAEQLEAIWRRANEFNGKVMLTANELRGTRNYNEPFSPLLYLDGREPECVRATQANAVQVIDGLAEKLVLLQREAAAQARAK
jgi:hypothetical protein